MNLPENVDLKYVVYLLCKKYDCDSKAVEEYFGVTCVENFIHEVQNEYLFSGSKWKLDAAEEYIQNNELVLKIKG